MFDLRMLSDLGQHVSRQGTVFYMHVYLSCITISKGCILWQKCLRRTPLLVNQPWHCLGTWVGFHFPLLHEESWLLFHCKPHAAAVQLSGRPQAEGGRLTTKAYKVGSLPPVSYGPWTTPSRASSLCPQACDCPKLAGFETPLKIPYLAGCFLWWWWHAGLGLAECVHARTQPRGPAREPQFQTCHSFSQWIWPGGLLLGVPHRSNSWEIEIWRLAGLRTSKEGAGSVPLHLATHDIKFTKKRKDGGGRRKEKKKKEGGGREGEGISEVEVFSLSILYPTRPPFPQNAPGPFGDHRPHFEPKERNDLPTQNEVCPCPSLF